MNRNLNIKLILLLWVLSVITQPAWANKEELRGVWVTTLLNIDWPSRSGLSTSQQKEEIRSILDQHQAQGINAIFLQVRPAADALYQSSYEPWSTWLTGTQGQEPRPFYDPLAYWISECHQRGMELHAWFNPFRAAVNDDLATLSTEHIIRKNPHWFINYGGRVYFDPGIPQVREYVRNVISEVAEKYKVDGIHFDDYFYPYSVGNAQFGDQQSYARYGGEMALEDWRRQNINSFIEQCAQSFNDINPLIRFGVSPFGVWRNQDRDPMGSATRAGHSNYDDLYADVLHWMKQGWIDYLAPQLYWHIGYDLADYEVLLDWWSQHSYGRPIYIGQSAYKVDKDADFRPWRSAKEISRHLRLNRKYPQVKGNIYFSSQSLRKNSMGLADTLQRYHYNNWAIVPPMTHKSAIELNAPEVYRISHGVKQIKLFWSNNLSPSDCRYLLVYRFEGDKNLGTKNMAHVVARVPAGAEFFIDTPPQKGFYTYVVTAVSKTNHESAPSFGLTINYRKRPPRRKKDKA